MELIERYLQAVKSALPDRERDDIIRELRDSILSQVEEREATRGRGLNEDEIVELLREMGSPTHLASRYRASQQLIGPATFPAYWKVLKTVLGLAFLAIGAVSLALAAAGRPLRESFAALARYPQVALTSFAWITLVFAGLEYFGAKLGLPDRWDPRELPPLVKEKVRRTSRAELLAQLAVQLIVGLWWLAGLRNQALILGPAYAFIRFAPIWLSIYPLFVVLFLTDVGLTLTMLARPQWSRGREVSRFVMSALGLVVLVILVNVSEVIVAPDGSSLSPEAAASVNHAVHVGLVVVLLINVLDVMKHVARLIGRRLEGGGRLAALARRK
jgi:hypothetical protein